MFSLAMSAAAVCSVSECDIGLFGAFLVGVDNLCHVAQYSVLAEPW